MSDGNCKHVAPDNRLPSWKPLQHMGEPCDLSCVVATLQEGLRVGTTSSSTAMPIDQYQMKQLLSQVVQDLGSVMLGALSGGIKMHRRDDERHFTFTDSKGTAYIIDPMKVNNVTYRPDAERKPSGLLDKPTPDTDSRLWFWVGGQAEEYQFTGVDADAVYLLLKNYTNPRSLP